MKEITFKRKKHVQASPPAFQNDANILGETNVILREISFLPFSSGHFKAAYVKQDSNCYVSSDQEYFTLDTMCRVKI